MKTKNKLFLMLGALMSLSFMLFPSIVFASEGSSGNDSMYLTIIVIISIFSVILIRIFNCTTSKFIFCRF